MASDWNLFLDRLLEHKLTVAEYRLATALMRLLLGWNRESAYLGQRLIRERASLDGRSFDRALSGLIEKGLLDVTPGKRGRGNRTLYRLVLGDVEKPAPARAEEEREKPAPARAKTPGVKARSHGKKSPLHSGHAGLEAGVKTSGGTSQTPTLQTRAFDVYLGAGGSLTLERERGALARSVTAQVKSGTAESEILAACRDLGRRREFPGLLKQRIAEIDERGGPCEWETLNRAGLTLAQLELCECAKCAEWATARAVPVTA